MDIYLAGGMADLTGAVAATFSGHANDHGRSSRRCRLAGMKLGIRRSSGETGMPRERKSSGRSDMFVARSRERRDSCGALKNQAPSWRHKLRSSAGDCVVGSIDGGGKTQPCQIKCIDIHS